jgi:[histone H3]-lysine36 N-dimethyltransferase SETMAR
MNERLQQRAVIRFLVAEERPPSEIHDRLSRVFGDDCLSRTQVFEWCRRFSEGHSSIDDTDRPGRPLSACSEENVARVEELVNNDRRVTVEEVAEGAGISVGSAHHILHDCLGMRKVCAKWVPKLLLPDQKATRVDICQDLLRRYKEQGESFLLRIVTQDESWFHMHEPETKESSKQWKHPDSPRPKKAISKPSSEKILYSFFWDKDGVIVQWPVEKGHTITGAYHAQLLRDQLHPALKSKRRGLITRGVLLQQDNAPAHTSHVAQAAVFELGYEVLPHPPYSPDLAPSDYFLFPRAKQELRGRAFHSRSSLGSAVFQCLERWSTSSFREALLDLPRRWDKCVRARGEYFESDDI